MPAEIKLDCKCISDDAKRNLMSTLNTVITLAEGNKARLEGEIEGRRKRLEDVPLFMSAALEHVKTDLANAQELKGKIALIPVCPTSL